MKGEKTTQNALSLNGIQRGNRLKWLPPWPSLQQTVLQHTHPAVRTDALPEPPVESRVVHTSPTATPPPPTLTTTASATAFTYALQLYNLYVRASA